MRVRRIVNVFAISILVASTSACVDVKAACVGVGICDAPLPAAIAIDIVCDSSSGSTCTKDAIEQTLDHTLLPVSERPGSTLRLWAMSGSVDGVVTLGVVTAPEFPAATRVRRAAQEAFIKGERTRLLAASTAAFTHPAQQSPIADTLARVLMAAGNEHRLIVLISDMREFDKGRFDFECGPLPTSAEFPKRLAHEGVMAPDAMNGVGVAFTFVGVPAIDGSRCAATIQRSRAIEAIWRALVTTNGGTVLAYTDGALQSVDIQR